MPGHALKSHALLHLDARTAQGPARMSDVLSTEMGESSREQHTWRGQPGLWTLKALDTHIKDFGEGRQMLRCFEVKMVRSADRLDVKVREEGGQGDGGLPLREWSWRTGCGADDVLKFGQVSLRCLWDFQDEKAEETVGLSLKVRKGDRPG